jgi:hypothetical protein
MRKPITRTVLVAALAALAVTGTATAARADPTGCTVTSVTNGARASCTGGTGLVRAGVDCIAKNEFDTTHYGQWVAVGGASTAICFGGSRVVDYWYEVA